MTPRLFLSAEWRYLIMINYTIDPAVLAPYIPKGTVLDLWKGQAFVSLVGFMFQDTRVLGLSIPFHKNFEEVNLRFYIKRKDAEGNIRRGVAFIKEIVPRYGIAGIARLLYNENYVALPMGHVIKHAPSLLEVKYEWKLKGKLQYIQVNCQDPPQMLQQESEEEFITEHYWGYSIQRNGETMEYQVKHPPWRIWKVDHHAVSVDMEAHYGPTFTPFLVQEPASCFLAEGSAVQVFKGEKRG